MLTYFSTILDWTNHKRWKKTKNGILIVFPKQYISYTCATAVYFEINIVMLHSSSIKYLEIHAKLNVDTKHWTLFQSRFLSIKYNNIRNRYFICLNKNVVLILLLICRLILIFISRGAFILHIWDIGTIKTTEFCDIPPVYVYVHIRECRDFQITGDSLITILTVFWDFNPERQFVTDSHCFYFPCPGIQDPDPWRRCFWCRRNTYHLWIPIEHFTWHLNWVALPLL